MLTKLGGPLPPGDPHGVSVYLPTWKDTEAWAQRDPKLLAQLKGGYPRFFVPLVNQDLAHKLLSLAVNYQNGDSVQNRRLNELSPAQYQGLLFPSQHLAHVGRAYLETHKKGPVHVLHVTWQGQFRIKTEACPPNRFDLEDLYVLAFPKELASQGKSFWQHTGYGVSGRCTTFWLENAPFLNKPSKQLKRISDLSTEEAEEAKVTLRKRVGGLLSSETHPVRVQDVYLYPMGMSAISNTAAALQCLKGDGNKKCKVVVFGFLYVDTFKVLSKTHGFDCTLYNYSAPSDLEIFETDLKNGLQLDAVYTEFPGNPLLASVDLERLHHLAEQYKILFVVDDTVATSVNVNILPHCDVVCTSLTKMFSGGCNVMGGSAVLNPQSSFYEPMQRVLAQQFVDTYFPQDALVMEKNSLDFESRVTTASFNANHLVHQLRTHPTVSKVFYPKVNVTEDIYNKYKRKNKGYGFLVTIEFIQPAAAIAFHDALDVAKGPSLGTNFTLCCAHTLYAHYSELEWAAGFGVTEHLVRISVGVESVEFLSGLVETALRAAEVAVSEKASLNGHS